MKLKYIVKAQDFNLTINQIMQNNLNISNRLRQQIINENLIFCNSLPCDTRNIANVGDIITINFDSFEDNSNNSIFLESMNANNSSKLYVWSPYFSESTKDNIDSIDKIMMERILSLLG